MLTSRRFILPVLAAVALALLGPPIASAQPTHGSVSTVSGQTLRVQLDDSLSVEIGADGRVVAQRRVGGERVQVSFAVLTVEQIERSFDGTWTAICRVERQSEDLQVGERVRFDSVFARSRLTLQTIPPNSVALIDSVEVGSTPVEVPIGVGAHTITFSKTGFRSVTRSLTIEQGEHRTLTDTLQAARGQLVVNTLPDGATVRISGRRLGRTPVSTELQSGTYTIRIQREGYLSASRTVKVPIGGEKRLNVPLQRPLEVGLSPQQPERIVDPTLERRDKRLLITYDLTGEADAYSVELQLSTDGGKTFESLPEAVAGAVGNEVTPGQDKQLVWSAIEDFPKGLTGPDNQLRLAVDESSGNTLFWVLGGALASGAAATVLGVMSGGDDGGSDGSGGGDLPSAPPPAP
jgi:hypothetical protein